MVQCGAVWCSVVQCGAVWCSVVQCGAVCRTEKTTESKLSSQERGTPQESAGQRIEANTFSSVTDNLRNQVKCTIWPYWSRLEKIVASCFNMFGAKYV